MNTFISTTAEYASYGALLAVLTPFGPWVVAIVAGFIVLAAVGPKLMEQIVIPLVALCSSGGPGERALALRAMSAGVKPSPKAKKRGKKRAGRPRGS